MIKNKFKVWMFHYVRPKNRKPLPYLNIFDIERFKIFLDSIQATGVFIDPEDFFNHIDKRTKIPPNSHLLTFDDGLSCHYNYVFPELIKRNIKAVFFIPSAPFLNKNMLQVHKAHCVYGSLGYEAFRKNFLLTAGLDLKYFDKIYSTPNAKKAYPFDNKQIAIFKYAINYILDPQLTKDVLNEIFENLKKLDEIKKTFYLSKKEIEYMSRKGMEFGFHGHSHRPFSKISREDLKQEFKNSEDLFLEIIGCTPKSLSYPFGDYSSVTNNQIEQISSFGIKFAFLAENHKYLQPMKIPRLDCNSWSSNK